MQNTLAYRLFFGLLDLLSKVFNIDTFVVLWYGAEFVMKSSIFSNTEGQMICRRYEPDISGIGWIGEYVQNNGKVLRGSSRDRNPIFDNRVLGLVEGSQPRCKVLSECRHAVTRPVLQGGESYRIVGEQFMGGLIK